MLWVEAEDFADYGGWILDTQFAHKMGSGYLLAPGVGNPVKDATTSVQIPSSGKWRVWVRTMDWVPPHHPGVFGLKVSGKKLDVRLGASGTREWGWTDAGVVDLERGSAELALVDESGFYARCDAIVLSRNAEWQPPHAADALAAFRRKATGVSDLIADGGEYDVAVVGGGPAGVPAAIAAARGGARVVLLQDRPVLGGNVSSELGVLLNGASGHPGFREGGIIEEAVLRKAHEAKGDVLSFSRVFAEMVGEEPLITTVLNCRVVSVEKSGESISAAIGGDLLSGVRTRYRARLFVDATGDGWVGYFAGAKTMFGREGIEAFGESCAPDKPDLTTMSGCLLGGYGLPRLKAVGTAKPYVTPEWAKVLPEGFYRKPDGLRFKWWLEHAGNLDDCADPELARDELLRIFFAYWGWLKNDCPDANVRALAAKHDLVSLPYMNGRREGMRLKGDMVYTEQDALTAKLFEDRIGHTGWPLDTHNPLGVNDPKGSGFWKRHPRLPAPASIPYRILYSENVPNLFMAGRNVSCTHVGLGTLRVAATCAVMGQAVGTAAAGCIRDGMMPREYGKSRIRDLQLQLQRDDQLLLDMRYEDPANKALAATVSATSAKSGNDASNVIDGYARTLPEGPSRGWVSNPHMPLPQALTLTFPSLVDLKEIRLTFDSDFYIKPKWVKHTMPKTLAKSYLLEASSDGVSWTVIADVDDNCRRLAVHRFKPMPVKQIRLTVRSTYGDASARVFEIMAY